MMHFTSVLLPAPFSPSSACTVPGRSRSDTVVERDERAEALGQTTRLEGERRGHDSVSSSAREVVTAPKTPFCILTILSAAAWLPASVAAQQSSRSTHS